MYIHEPSYKSQHVNTDKFGLRYTKFDGNNYSIESALDKFESVSIIVGGSTAFGVGSSHDSKTISSILSAKNQNLFLNFGGRAFGCNQELILFLQFAEKLKKLKMS